MKYILFIIPFFFGACVNSCGFSASYYSAPKEYYDSHGVWHKEFNNDIDWCKPRKPTSLFDEKEEK